MSQAPKGQQPGSFLTFLPEDNQTWRAQEVLDHLNDDLASLLRLPASEFWHIVEQDGSLHLFIDSYLHHKRRVYDEHQEDVQGTSAASQQLARRAFMVLLRMVSPGDRDRGAPPASRRAELLYNNWLLDVAKLMDLCVLYSPHARALTAQLVQQVFALQPRYWSDVQSAAPLLVANLAEVARRCGEAAAKLLRGGGSGSGSGSGGSSSKEQEAQAAAKELWDMSNYLRDACVTLGAFVGCYPPAAVPLLGADHGALLGTLAALHERQLPALARALAQPGVAAQAGAGAGAAAEYVPQLLLCCRRLLYILLRGAFLSPPRQGSGGSSSSSASSHKAAEARGNELMTALMALTAVVPAAAGSSSAGSGQLLPLLNREHALDEAVAEAMLEGIVALDDTQFEYLLALMGSDASCMDRAKRRRSGATASSSSPAAAAAGASAPRQQQQQQHGLGPSGSGAGPSSSSSSSSGAAGAAAAAAAAKRAPLIRQVKELLPDYGDGFVAACLEALGENPERVINHLLEGNLPDHLRALDTKLASWPPPAAATPARPDPTGKGKGTAPPASPYLDLPVSASQTVAGMSSWAGMAATAADSAAAAPAALPPPPPRNVTAGAGSGSGPLRRGMLKVLDRTDRDVRQATARLGEDLQWEYDDEYDDSFDDLQATADGLDDAEGGEGNIEGGPLGVRRPGQPAPRPSSRLRTAGAAAYEDEPDDAASSGPRRQAAGASGGALGAAARRAPVFVPGAAAAPGGAGGRGGAAGRGGRGGAGGRGERLWVLDGRIYNYAKEGATAVSSREEAQRLMEAAKAEALAIHGLGAGGNKAMQTQHQPQPQGRGAGRRDSSSGAEDDGGAPRPGGPGRGPGGGRGPPGGGGGRGRGSHDHKEKNKAHVGNHNRKDRAARKQGMF